MSQDQHNGGVFQTDANYTLTGTMTGGTFASNTVTSPTITGGTQSAPTITAPLIVGSTVQAAAAPAAGGASSYQVVTKTKTAIADNTATDVFTVTIPNPAVNANCTIIVKVLGVIGAGGAVGAGETASGSIYIMSVARTVGVTAVIATGTQLGVASGKVSGGDTFTCTVAASAVTGGATVTETFTIQVTAHDSTGSAANHTAILVAELINAATGGITIA